MTVAAPARTIMKSRTSCTTSSHGLIGLTSPCLVTYNPISQIDGQKIIKKWWFQHILHDACHVALIIHMVRFIQGKQRTWYCGALTLVNSQETCLVSGLATARLIGADYPFYDPRV